MGSPKVSLLTLMTLVLVVEKSLESHHYANFGTQKKTCDKNLHKLAGLQ